MPEPTSRPGRSRRTLVGALVVVALGGLLVAVSHLALSESGSDDDRRALRDEVESVTVEGARLVSSSWDDERHERYIDTGGFDSPAGWTFRYELPAPVPVGEVVGAYAEGLAEHGWRVVERDEVAGRLVMFHGPEGSSRRLVLDPEVSRRREVDGPGDSPLRSEPVPETWRFTVTATLPYEDPPRYGG